MGVYGTSKEMNKAKNHVDVTTDDSTSFRYKLSLLGNPGNDGVLIDTKNSRDDYTTGCLLDYQYFLNYYQLIAIDLSKQK